MWAKRSITILFIMFVVLSISAACTPQVVSETAEGSWAVEVPPMLVPGQSDPPPGQSEPNSAPNEPPPTGPGVSEEKLIPGNMVGYTNNTYHFSLQFPANFASRILPDEKLKQLEPSPLVSFHFINPEIATSDLADLTPPDLEVRVYDAGGNTSLESWLSSNGQGNTGQVVPFETENASGLKVCASTMIFPGCSYYFIMDEWIYQLIPTTLAGEAMRDSFTLN